MNIHSIHVAVLALLASGLHAYTITVVNETTRPLVVYVLTRPSSSDQGEYDVFRVPQPNTEKIDPERFIAGFFDPLGKNPQTISRNNLVIRPGESAEAHVTHPVGGYLVWDQPEGEEAPVYQYARYVDDFQRDHRLLIQPHKYGGSREYQAILFANADNFSTFFLFSPTLLMPRISLFGDEWV